MTNVPTLPTARNPYDTEDPDNYLASYNKTGGSNILPWMFIGMFAFAAVIGLFFGQESPLPKVIHIHLTENTAPVQSGESKFYR